MQSFEIFVSRQRSRPPVGYDHNLVAAALQRVGELPGQLLDATKVRVERAWKERDSHTASVAGCAAPEYSASYWAQTLSHVKSCARYSPASRSRSRSRASPSRRTISSPSRASAASTPNSPSHVTSRAPTLGVATTGVPLAIASMYGTPKPS